MPIGATFWHPLPSTGGGGGGGGALWMQFPEIERRYGTVTESASHASGSLRSGAMGGIIGGSQWSTGASQVAGMYARWDFGSALSLSGVRMILAHGDGVTTDYARAYDVQGSSDASTWTTVRSRTAATWGSTEDTWTAQSFRYWQIILTTGVVNWWRVNQFAFRVET